jgi:hypothetical protein
MSHEFNPVFGVAPMHWDMLTSFLNDGPDKQREDRMFCFGAFRESSKTTWFGVCLATYFACLNGDVTWDGYKLPILNYFILKGKTSGTANKTMTRITNSLQQDKLVKTFGNKMPTFAEVRNKQGKSTNTFLITKDKFVLESMGILNPIRGANVYGRPKVVIYDDPESPDNTKTLDIRESNMNDLYGETIPAIDSRDGRLVYIGNMVHQDCILANLLKNESWIRRCYPITYLKDGIETPMWPKKFPLNVVAKRKKFYFNNPKKGKNAFYREYYNKIVSDTTPVFIRDTEWKYVRKHGVNYLQKENEFRNIYITIGYDPAQSDKEWACDSAIIVMAMDYTGQKYIIDYFLGRLDLHDKYDKGYTPIYPFALSDKELIPINKRGGIEELCRYVTAYYADEYWVETASQQRGIFNDVRDRLDRTPRQFLKDRGYEEREMGYTIGGTYTPHMDKIQKLACSVMRQFESGSYICTTHKKEIEDIVNTFPSSNLDLLDAMFLADLGLKQPNKVEFNPLSTNRYYQLGEGASVPKIELEESWMAA